MRYKTIAYQLAHHLGTIYSPWDPRSWSENDKQVFDIMMQLNRDSYEVVKSLYGSIYVPGQSLDLDLVKHLDTKYYRQIPLFQVQQKQELVNGRPMKIYAIKPKAPDVTRKV